MELFIKKIAAIMSNGSIDTKAIIDTLLYWKSIIDETIKIRKDLLANSNESASLYKQLEKQIKIKDDEVENISTIEKIFMQKMSSQLLYEIRECHEFRNIVSPFIIKYSQIMKSTDSTKCLEEIVGILKAKYL
jgi:hypothetical protein